MRIVSAARGAVIGAVVVLALAACTPPHPTHPSATGSHSATASPTPTAAALTAPRSAIPAGCAQLLPTATAAGAFPAASGILPRQTESTPPQDVIQVAARQVGGLHCLWGGTNREDNG